MKPTHERIQKARSKMDQTFSSDKKTRPDSFHLANTEGRELEHSLNADNLHHFYISHNCVNCKVP
jgi:hypothetical protein